MKNKKIVIAGGTGYIGQMLSRYFGKENDIVILGRNVKDHENNNYDSRLLQPANGYRIRYVPWNGKTVESHWLQEITGCDIVINLAGKSVNCRYSKKNKQALIDSRVLPTLAIGEAIRQAITPPKLWINASSATIYSHSLHKPQDEFTGTISERRVDNMPYNLLDRLRHPKDTETDISVKVCNLWEQAFFTQRTPFTRKVALRTAITLGKGGILVPYLNLCKLWFGGRHGNGAQRFSWVHEEDVCRMIEWLWEEKELEGVFNCAAPGPVTNEAFMRELRKATGRSFGLPAPTWLLEIGACLIRTETELMLKSRYVLPARALSLGFRFKHPHIQPALTDILHSK